MEGKTEKRDGGVAGSVQFLIVEKTADSVLKIKKRIKLLNLALTLI